MSADLLSTALGEMEQSWVSANKPRVSVKLYNRKDASGFLGDSQGPEVEFS